MTQNSFEISIKNGIEYFHKGNFEKAEFIFSNLLNENPERIDFYTYLIPSLINLKKYSIAKKYSEKLFILHPKVREVSLVYLGIINHQQEKFEEAKNYFKRSLKLNPNNSQTLLNLGFTYHKLNQNVKAILFTKESIKNNKHNSTAYQNIASYLEDDNQLNEAINYLNQAIKINEKDFDSIHALSLLQLLTLDYENGLENFEKRFLSSSLRDKYSQIPRLKPGMNVEGKKILIWFEQGLGDTIQFSIFVNQIIDLGGIVTFEVQKPLQKFLSMQFSCKVTNQTKLTEFDYQIPLMSLMDYFKINSKSINKKSYNFKNDNEKILYWKEKLSLSNKKTNIGISISGNKKYKKEYRRCVDLNKFIELTDQYRIFLIQKDITPQERIIVDNHDDIIFLGDNPDWKDFTDSAAIVQNMNLIISIDTSLIHLAGAMSKRSYLLLSSPPDWRWGYDSDHEINWYESVEIIRQKYVGNWDYVIKKLKLILKK